MPDSSNVILPVGTVVAWAGKIDNDSLTLLRSDGWLLCDGQPVSGSDEEYRILFETIGTLYGIGLDAAGHKTGDFNLPDYRGRFLRGVDGGSGADPDVGSRARVRQGTGAPDLPGSVQDDQFKEHAHTVRTDKAPIGQGVPAATGGFANGPAYAPQTGYVTISMDTAGGKETRPKNVSVNYIIKYKQV